MSIRQDLFDAPAGRLLALQMARKQWRRLPRWVCTVADLHAAALRGLWEAACRYDPFRGGGFTRYASCIIRGTMLDLLRELDPLPRAERRRGRLAPCSLERERTKGDNPRSLRDAIADPSTLPNRAADAAWAVVEKATRGLSARERHLIGRYYGDGAIMRELAPELGTSQSGVSQLHEELLERMRYALECHGIARRTAP